MKVSPQKFFCYCAQFQEILIVFIGRKHVVNPVDLMISDLKLSFRDFRVSLIGLSIYSFSLVKEDALEKRREQLRIKKEITQKVYDEFEAETTKKNE